MSPILKVDGVTKTFQMPGSPVLEILKGVSFSLNEGETLVICGSSGSGKTTLLNILGGLDLATEGGVEWKGESLRGLSRKDLARRRNREVAYVFQAYHLLPELTVIENVLVPGWIRREENRDLAEEVIAKVGLKERRHHRPNELSGGEQQRVAVARALYQDPNVILADEPTGNLDSSNSRRIFELLQELASESKKALVLVTHDFSIAERVGRVKYLIDGVLTETPPVEP
ncbi:MAG: ABC transporter ATP-binding protein [Verrucomicrobiota bacterium]